MARTRIGGRLVIAATVATASIGIGVGSGLALAGDEAEPDARFAGPEQLDQGVSPNENTYVISRVANKQRGICLEVAAREVAGEACLPMPEEGEVSEPVEVGLGSDLFVLALANGEVKGSRIDRLRVARADGRGSGTSPSAVTFGSLRLVYSILNAPESTLPQTDFGLPIPPALTVEALGADGQSKREHRLAAPRQGGGDTEAGPAHDGKHDQERPTSS